MFTNQVKDECDVFAVEHVEHHMNAMQADGNHHISVTTTQEEYRHDYEEPIKKEILDGIIMQAPLLNDTPWHPPEELVVRGIYRVRPSQHEPASHL